MFSPASNGSVQIFVIASAVDFSITRLFPGGTLNSLTLARPAAVLLTAALALLAFLAGAAPAHALAYDSQITGKVVGPDGKPVPGLFVSPFTEADLPLGSSSQDSAQYTTTQTDGSYSFRADSSTVYKVRFSDAYGYYNAGTGAVRNPLTFADKWYGGKSGFDLEAGYNSAKKIVISTPGIVNLGTSYTVLGTLPKYGVLSAPKISGELKYGKQLFATPGSWAPRPLLGWNYVWYRGTTRIGAGQTYVVGADDVGQGPIRVVVSASHWGQYGYTESKSATVSVPAVTLPSPGVTIQGLPRVNEWLTATIPIPAGLTRTAVNGHKLTAVVPERNPDQRREEPDVLGHPGRCGCRAELQGRRRIRPSGDADPEDCLQGVLQRAAADHPRHSEARLHLDRVRRDLGSATLHRHLPVVSVRHQDPGRDRENVQAHRL